MVKNLRNVAVRRRRRRGVKCESIIVLEEPLCTLYAPFMHPFILLLHLHQPYVHLCSPVIHVYTPHLPLNNPLNNPLNTPLNALKQPIKQVPGTGLPLSMVVYLGRIPTMLYILFVYPLIALIAAVRSSKVHPPLYLHLCTPAIHVYTPYITLTYT